MKDIERVCSIVVDAGFKIHKELGPGLLESVYEAILERGLQKRGLAVERQKIVSFEYDGMKFDDCLRIDLLVEGILVVELKSVEKSAPVHSKQVFTYLRLMNLPLGLLVNFGTALYKDGVDRVINMYHPYGAALLKTNTRPRDFTAFHGDN